MLAYEPSTRLTLYEVLEHNWIADGPIATSEEVYQEIKDRIEDY